MDEMNETNVTETNPAEETAEKTGKKMNGNTALRIVLRVLTVIFSILLVLVGIVLVANRDKLNLDSAKRYLTYRALERNEKGQSEAFPISNEGERTFQELNDGLLLTSGSRILLYGDNGTAFVDMNVSMNNPVVSKAGDYALVYDAGGSELYLFSGRQMAYSYKAEGDNNIISARVNQNGWLAVNEQASGYKGAVTVYNASQTPIITENISSGFVMDAIVSPDNKQLAVVTVGQDGVEFSESIHLYSCSDGSEQAVQAVSTEPEIDIRWDSRGIWLQEQYGVRLLDNQLQTAAQWEEPSMYLRSYALNRNSYIMEYMSRYRSGTVGTLTILNDKAEVTASLQINEEVASVTSCGRYIAVLTNSRLTVYTSDLQEYASLDDVSGVSQAVVRSDGTVLLIMEDTARIFLP